MKWRGGCFVPSTPDCTLDMYYKYRRPSRTDYRPDSSPAQRRMERTCPLVDRLVPRIRGPQNRGPRRPKAATFRLVRLSSADVEARESSGWIGFFKWAMLPACPCMSLPSTISPVLAPSPSSLDSMWLNKSSILFLAFVSAVLSQYTGPCSTSACGAEGKPCPRGYLCVPYPHVDPALRKGCTCSYG
jgi:hypothetical protein